MSPFPHRPPKPSSGDASLVPCNLCPDAPPPRQGPGGLLQLVLSAWTRQVLAEPRAELRSRHRCGSRGIGKEPERGGDREKENGVQAGDARSEAESWMAERRLPAPHAGAQVGAAGCWGKCQRSGAPGKQPFSGKSFYLDLPAGDTLQFLTGTIQQLGGVIEGFLSKEVTYIVSSRLEAKRESLKGSPRNCPSPGEVRVETPSSRAPPKGSPTRPVLRPNSSAPLSRGKELLRKAVGSQGSSCSLVSQARAWGVRVLHVNEMMARVQQLPLNTLCGTRQGPRKRQGSCPAAESRTRKVAQLQAPFLKVEDESRNFRPCQHQFKTFPELSFLGPKEASPFEALLSPGGSRPDREPRDAETSPGSGARRRTGYCECCQQAFEELHGHLQSAQHQRFARGAQSYAEVDGIIAQLCPGLTGIRTQAHLPRTEEPEEQSTPGPQEWTRGHLQAPPETVGTGETLTPGAS
ncbi:protein DBF4 homolog B [Sorex fumeus]|uniref:protein DBF4 homolog B n=1 Tax=Sorex fumeus TaxID=62283 RepID=UPI0024ADC066|nr:protein DBF4 homolog B [Sorex fumeus]